MEEIAKIIYEYSINNKVADEKFIKDIVNILIDSYGLDYYIKDLIISKNILKSSGYDMVTSEMTIIPIQSYVLFAELFPWLVKNKALFINLDVALTIFHEVDHALLKKLKELDKDILDVDLYKTLDKSELVKKNSEGIKKITSLSKEELKSLLNGYIEVIRKNIYYNNHHDSAPFERRAYINSHLHLSRIIDILYDTDLSDKDLDKIRFYHLRDFIKTCKTGYKTMREITNSPSYDYIKNIGEESKLDKVKIYDFNPYRAYNNVKMYRLRDRVLYGLPLESQELKELNMKSNPFRVYEKKSR